MFRTPFGLLLLSLDTLLLAPPIMLSSLFSQRATDALVRLWCRIVLFACGVRLSTHGGETLSPGASYVFISNHASHLDAPSIFLTLQRPVRYVAKESLLRIPMFGWAVRAIGTIAIDRDNSAETRTRMEKAEAALPAGTSVLFFAEGTRSDDGSLQPFKRGGAVLALRRGLPIVPVAVRGTRAIHEKGSLRLRSGPVRVDIGEPIATTGFTYEQRGELTDLVRTRVTELLSRP